MNDTEYVEEVIAGPFQTDSIGTGLLRHVVLLEEETGFPHFIKMEEKREDYDDYVEWRIVRRRPMTDAERALHAHLRGEQ